jgi:hypothetical protein
MTCRLIIVCLLVLLPWSPGIACATSSDVTLPPGFTIKWNIEPRDSVVEQDFVVTEYRYYRFEIKFSSTRDRNSVIADDELHRIRKFAGDGSYWYVTKDSASTDHPEVVIAKTPEEVHRRDEGIAKGDILYQAANPGVIVPVHIRIEQMDTGGTIMVHTDKVVDTENTERVIAGGLIRLIIEIKLKPGKCRLRANTLKETPLPPDMETFLRAVNL